MPDTELAFAEHDHGQCRETLLDELARAAKTRGLRLTPARVRVLELLGEAHQAMGAYELLDRLRAMADPTTEISQHPRAAWMTGATTPEESRAVFRGLINLLGPDGQPEAGLLDLDVVRSAWQELIDAANRHFGDSRVIRTHRVTDSDESLSDAHGGGVSHVIRSSFERKPPQRDGLRPIR